LGYVDIMLKTIVLVALVQEGFAQHTKSGPVNPSKRPDWLNSLKNVRTTFEKQHYWAGGVFDEVNWTQTSYIQPQMHTYDRFFYDPKTKQYTVKKYLDDLNQRYGGIDSVLIWPTYPTIGIDDRNQFDYFRAMPGGLDAITNFTKELHANGVKVMWPYNPWDSGTHREDLDDANTFAKLLKETGGDGFNGDTMRSIPQDFWTAGKALDYPLAFQPELGGMDSALNWTTMGWGYWGYPKIPLVDRFKFITSGKFMTNICDRWKKEKTDLVQHAWFNGDGVETWENVWGTWNGITEYDGEQIRRMAKMSRFFGKRGYLNSKDWEPHTADTVQEDVYGSKWPLADSTLWTVVNRQTKNVTNTSQIVLEEPDGQYYYDCYNGVELQAVPAPPPPPIPDGYSFFPGHQANVRHGAVAIDQVSVASASVAGCVAICEADPMCQCVTHDLSSGACMRRMDCQPSLFQDLGDSSMGVYMKKQGYSEYIGKTINPNQAVQVLENVSASDCERQCDVATCSCASYNADTLICALFSSCDPDTFTENGNFILLLSEARRLPAPPPPPKKYLNFPMEAHGYGCALQLSKKADDELITFLGEMKNLTSRHLASFAAVWEFLPQTMVEIPKTNLAKKAPSGMVRIPSGEFNFISSGVEIEGSDSAGVDVQFPWESSPKKFHVRNMNMTAFYIDKYPVTTTNYSSYLKATGYKPDDSFNWLKNWNGQSTPPAEFAEVPVTYVGLEEARKYCAWAGARLPHTYEWQYAAQGTDRRTYPWGSQNNASNFPQQTNGTKYMGPEPVTAHSPEGDSPFGVADLVGNVWQYTTEFRDAHTRSVLLRGGSNYRSVGSNWYFPQAKELNRHEKLFLMDDRYERAGTVGFRCVVDAEEEESVIIF